MLFDNLLNQNQKKILMKDRKLVANISSPA